MWSISSLSKFDQNEIEHLLKLLLIFDNRHKAKKKIKNNMRPMWIRTNVERFKKRKGNTKCAFNNEIGQNVTERQFEVSEV